jgi:hypothetical protein
VQPARTTHDEVRQEPPVRIVAPDLAGEPGTRPVYTTPPTMLKVEQIMAELSAITAEPVFGERSRARVARPAGRARIEDSDDVTVDVDARADDSTTGRQQSDPSLGSSSAVENVPKIIPTLPPRPSDVARRASDAAHAARTRFLTNQPPDLLEPTATAAPTLPTLPVATPSRPVVAAATASTVPAPTVSELAADLAAELQNDLAVELADGLGRLLGEQAVTSGIVATPATEGDADVVHVEAIIDDLGPGSDGTDGEPGGPAPSQRQVELAVAATDQLIESLKREDGLKRLSVRVVLRTGDHREVEAEAEWEAS